jgi:hypothetical protein
MTDTTAAPTEPAAAPAAAPAAPAAPSWLGENPDPELLGHVQNKAWASPADAVKGHRELEKMLGADRAGRTVVLPAAEDAPEWGQVFDRLGRPASAEGYKLPVPEGADPKFAQAASAKMHELGLTAKQGAALAAWWNEQAGGATAAQAAAEEAALAAEHRQLEKDWGVGPDAAARRELARRAAVNLGLDEASIEALEKVAGYSKTMKALAKMGDLLKEAGAEGLGNMGGFGMTPEGARARRSQLMADKEWRSKAMNPQSAEWAELQKMDRIIASVMQ